MRVLRRGLCALILSGCLFTPAHSESLRCEVDPPGAPDIAAVMASASQLKDWLNQHDASVVLLVRRGQDMEKYQLQFSHAGWALRQADGHWRVYHNLNECGSGHSSLYVQGLYQFLADGLVSNDIAVLRFPPALEQQLLNTLADTRRIQLLHSSWYSMVAYPFSGPYQNSNGWVLEVFALANQPQVWSRDDARRWLRAQDYQPSVLSVSALKRKLAGLVMPHMYSEDQPSAVLDKGTIQLNSGDSVIRFMARYAKPVADCEHRVWGETVCLFEPVINAP